MQALSLGTSERIGMSYRSGSTKNIEICIGVQLECNTAMYGRSIKLNQPAGIAFSNITLFPR